jgi:hypothetical protein
MVFNATFNDISAISWQVLINAYIIVYSKIPKQNERSPLLPTKCSR